MSGMSMCRVVRIEGRGRRGLGGYQPGVNVPLKALFLVYKVLRLSNLSRPICMSDIPLGILSMSIT